MSLNFKLDFKENKKRCPLFLFFLLKLKGQAAAVCGGFWPGPNITKGGLPKGQGRLLLADWVGPGSGTVPVGWAASLSNLRGNKFSSPKERAISRR